MKVENIVLKTHLIKYENSKFKELIETNKHLIPNKFKQTLSFDILETNEAFANGIRRVFNDELLVKCLDISVHNITTNDKYILPDNIKERINLISLDQSIRENVIFSLNIVNNTNDTINIYTSDLLNKNKNDNNNYFNKNIQICTLKSNKFINISSITINKEYGYNNNVYSIGSFKYKCINTDFNKSSLNNNLKNFHLEFTNNANIEMKTLISNIYSTLFIRLKKIQDNVNSYIINDNAEDVNFAKSKNSDIYIIANNSIKDLNSTDQTNNNINDLYEIYINNEYHTIGNLITKYVFLLNEDIELINYRLIHPLTHKIIISIKHPEYKKIINDSIEQIIKDLLLFKNTIINKA
jgi:DNA-directed RNA polymerase subunit L